MTEMAVSGAGASPDSLHAELRALITASRQRLASAVNAELTRLYWTLGQRLAVLELDSELVQRRFWLRDSQVMSIGCSHWADVALPNDLGLDSIHFAVQTESSRCYLRDLGSSSGVRVNGRRVESTTLHDGDEITVGQARLRVRLEGSPVN